MPAIRQLLGAAFAAALLAAPARGDDAPLDYQAVRDAIPEMKELSQAAADRARALHELVDGAETTQDGLAQRELRGRIASLLTEYAAGKRRMVEITKSLLRLRPSGQSDQEIATKLAETNLRGIRWDSGTRFRKAVEDLSAAVGIPIRLQHRVVQMNTLELQFREAPAETVLSTLCSGFDLRYVIYDGEIVVYKQITPTEERFLEYQAKHPETKLRYWEREKASGEYKEPEGGPAPAAGAPAKRDVTNIDFGLLGESLLKIWIVEAASERYNQMRIAQKSFDALTPVVLTGDEEIDRQNIEARRKVDKHLRHYIQLELDGAIEVIDICRRVLGAAPAAAGAVDADAKALADLMATELPAIDWKGKDLEAALRDLGRWVKAPVEWTPVPKHVELTVTYSFDAGFTLMQVLEYVKAEHPLEVTCTGGTLKFNYVGDVTPLRPGQR